MVSVLLLQPFFSFSLFQLINVDVTTKLCELSPLHFEDVKIFLGQEARLVRSEIENNTCIFSNKENFRLENTSSVPSNKEDFLQTVAPIEVCLDSPSGK